METFDLPGFMEALQRGNIAVIVGFVLMILVLISRRILQKVLSKKDLDLFAAIAATVLSIATGLVAGNGDWLSITESLISGLLVGATAIGLWELVGSRIEEMVKARNNAQSDQGTDSAKSED